MWLVFKLYFTLIITQLVKNLPAMQESLHSWVRKIHWRRDRLPTPVFLGFPCGSAGKESTCDAVQSLGCKRSPGEGNGHPLQYSCLENPMDRGAWGAPVHGAQRAGHDWMTNTLWIYLFSFRKPKCTASLSHENLALRCKDKIHMRFQRHGRKDIQVMDIVNTDERFS